MSWDKDWTKAKHPITDELLEKLYHFLVSQIDSGNGKYRAKIGDIMTGMGIVESDHGDWYGTIFHALKEIRSRYPVQSRTLGRAGNEYFLTGNEEIPHSNDIDYKAIVEQVHYLVVKAEDKDAVQTLRILKQIMTSYQL